MASSSFPFDLLPNEMKFAVLSHLPLSSLLNFRLVSSSCKNLVSAFHRNFTCPVNDTTYATLSKATEIFHTIKVSNLSGPKKQPVSSTRGVGRLVYSAKCLHLVGTQIDSKELEKIMHYPKIISDLRFEHIGTSVLEAAFASGRMYFGSVTTLTLMFHYGDIGEQSDLLLRLSRLVQCLPNVYHLKFRWTSSQNACQNFTVREALLKLMAYKSITLFFTGLRSLKSLEIDRDSWTTYSMSNFLSLDFLSEHELADNQRDPPGISGILILTKLESLNLTMFKGEGVYDACKLEHALLHSQWPHLKTLTVRNTFPSRVLQTVELPTWLGFLPATPAANLTQVTISFSPYTNAPLSMAPFSDCKVLKELTVNFFCDAYRASLDHQVCRVSELERLPKTLERLKFIPPRDLPRLDYLELEILQLSQSCLLLTKSQLEWLAEGNLPRLKYLGCMLVANGKEFERDKAIRTVTFWLSESTRGQYFTENVDLPLFQKLVGLEQLKTLEFNMMDAADAFSRIDDVVEWISLVHETSGRALEDYFDICRENGKLETEMVPHKYYELTAYKN